MPRSGRSVDAGLHTESCLVQLKRSAATAEQIATIGAVFRRGPGRSQPALIDRRIGLRSAGCDRAVTHRAVSVSGGSRRTAYDGSKAAFPIRSPPRRSLRVPSASPPAIFERADEGLRNYSHGDQPFRSAPISANHSSGMTRAQGAAATIDFTVKKLLSIAPMLMYQHSRSGVFCPGR
jgi:hypothetical protein